MSSRQFIIAPATSAPTAVIPTAQQIDSEHRLAQAQAGEAVQHAINCGLMLLEVKANLNHGEWLSWLRAQQESGAISFSQQTASTYMRLASNYQRVGNLEVSSIRKALELLSDDPDSDSADLFAGIVDEVATPERSPSVQAIIRSIELLPSDERNELIDSLMPATQVTEPPPHISQATGFPEWYTPPEYLDAARKVMGGIDLDPASSAAANAVVNAKRYYTRQENGLIRPWCGRVWLNPPYATDLIGQFIAKLAEHVTRGDVTQAMVLVNNATETAWFNDLSRIASAYAFPKGRVKFWNPEKPDACAPLQGQALVYIGDNVSQFLEVFSPFGWCTISPAHLRRFLVTYEQGTPK